MTSRDPDHEAHVQHADVGSAPVVTPASTKRMVSIGLGVAAVLVVLFVASFLPRRAVLKELAAEVAGDTVPPVVQVTTVQLAAAGGEVELPGTIQALHEGAIYARVSGYVRRWNVDIGSTVRTGDVLAEIDAPELAQQVEQARHQVVQARVALGLARSELERWKLLAADSAVSREEFDQKQASYDAAVANTGSAEANLQRLVDMQNFTHVTAPFSGVVTARNIDIGSLITAAGASSAPVAAGDVAGAQGPGSVFRIAQTDTVRTYLSVPESYSTAMSVGLPAQVAVQELRARSFTGRIARTSHALDVTSRTLLTEVDIANPGFVLMPGMYAQVRLHFPVTTRSLIIPSTALVIRSQGTQVMVLDTAPPGGVATVHLRAVQVGRDFGPTMEIVSGLTEGTAVVANPTADLVDGMRVHVVAAPLEGGAPVASPDKAAPAGRGRS